MNPYGPDARTTWRAPFGWPVHVDLWEGLFRDRVTVWMDVRPALGGHVRSWRGWRGSGRKLYKEAIAWVIECTGQRPTAWENDERS